MSRNLDKTEELLLYATPNGEVKIEAYFQGETVWLSQKKMTDLFGID